MPRPGATRLCPQLPPGCQHRLDYVDRPVAVGVCAVAAGAASRWPARIPKARHPHGSGERRRLPLVGGQTGSPRPGIRMVPPGTAGRRSQTVRPDRHRPAPARSRRAPPDAVRRQSDRIATARHPHGPAGHRRTPFVDDRAGLPWPGVCVVPPGTAGRRSWMIGLGCRGLVCAWLRRLGWVDGGGWRVCGRLVAGWPV